MVTSKMNVPIYQKKVTKNMYTTVSIGVKLMSNKPSLQVILLWSNESMLYWVSVTNEYKETLNLLSMSFTIWPQCRRGHFNSFMNKWIHLDYVFFFNESNEVKVIWNVLRSIHLLNQVINVSKVQIITNVPY